MSKAPFKFEEFYEAFSKSVPSDVTFEDGQIHIVPRKEDTPATTQKAAVTEPHVAAGPIRKHTKGRLLDSADRRRLPWSIRALLEAQEPDGSWSYSSSFEFILHGVAPPPMEGISGKLWATAIAITVWRQFPEYFELLETNYEKALLHADENVLLIVRSVLQFDSLDQIRPYQSDEARVIREQLAREAAAKRELEMGEELRIERMREEEIRIGKLSLVHARHLPMPTQQLFVSELGNEITKVFTVSPNDAESSVQKISTFKVGQLVESCRRRANNCALSIASTPTRWHKCRIAAIDDESCLLQLDFFDGSRERQRRVPMKFVRATAEGARETREAEFEALKRSWSQPITCNDEIARLEEARAIKLRPLPWEDRHHLAQLASSGDEKRPEQRTGCSQRPRSSVRRPLSGITTRKDSNRPVDTLFQATSTILLRYDRAYERVQAAVQVGTQRYAAAVLYRERFHAFDELTESILTLVESTVDALDAIWRWKKESSSGTSNINDSKTFIWRGADFFATLVRSLDFLGTHRELVEWYGEEFPLDGNPFMRSLSLLDKAAERGVENTAQERRPQSALRAALKLHGREPDLMGTMSSAPTWWPEAHYSRELLRRIDLAEQALIAELLSSRWLEMK